MSSDKYKTLMQDMIQQIPNTKYIFEITKCCNYSTFVLVSRRGTLNDLYKEVSLWFECRTVMKLYTTDSTGVKTTVPMTDMVTIASFISTNNLKPLYPLPHNIVYRIYIDDGHAHDVHTEEITG